MKLLKSLVIKLYRGCIKRISHITYRGYVSKLQTINFTVMSLAP